MRGSIRCQRWQTGAAALHCAGYVLTGPALLWLTRVTAL
jgi:hypothetical protein